MQINVCRKKIGMRIKSFYGLITSLVGKGKILFDNIYTRLSMIKVTAEDDFAF